jgi:glycosyltransferase involved in cell wall biosynthesis
MTQVQVNTRYLAHKRTGVQRYTEEILSRIGELFEPISPSSNTSGILGHLWEQIVLPFRVGNRLFWNPTCPGPVAVPNQVVTVHDLTVIEHPEWFGRKYALWNRLLIPLVLQRAQHVITVSRYTKNRVQDCYGLPKRDITVVHNGVDDRFRPVSDGRVQEVRDALDLPSDPYVLSLSAHEPRKNLGRLIAAWKHMLDRTAFESMPFENPPCLVLAGSTAQSDVFQDFSLGEIPSDVILPGYIPDEFLPALYRGAEAFVYPSLYEGFGLPALEAMACGTPVLTSNTTSIPEVTGSAAVLVDPTSVEAIACGLQRLLTDPNLRTRLEKAGIERAQLFTWERTASETWAVLKRQLS